MIWRDNMGEVKELTVCNVCGKDVSGPILPHFTTEHPGVIEELLLNAQNPLVRIRKFEAKR